MIEDTPTEANARHEQFLRDVVTHRTVWGLRNDVGWAKWQSDDDPESSTAPFWSDRETAKACAASCFPGYQPESMDLDDFLGSFLPFLCEQDVWVGTNLTTEMTGIDLPASELITKLREGIVEPESGHVRKEKVKRGQVSKNQKPSHQR